ncbi:5604_t:CDS:2 [Ambispora gerdemannii]|uniref:5603_t:CDS:1 n=1 Tax=Ambispora gerdemannii TaxID=144530 RepID=A0A9N9BSX1_9GLOM|nr:5603_t:CDS:2 [Ambispora gerdemannii]CAG8579918.1 5604_t:CDS:2 [Ambispora gerdemannii]
MIETQQQSPILFEIPEEYHITQPHQEQRVQTQQTRIPINCVYQILAYIDHDTRTLASLMLVSRMWAEAVVSIIWANPFVYFSKPGIIGTYISCLASKERKKLWRKGFLVATKKRKRPTFNYAVYLKELSLGTLFESVEIWISRRHKGWASIKDAPILWEAIYKLLLSQRSNLQSLSLDWGKKSIWQQYPRLLETSHKNAYLKSLKKISLHYIPDWQMLLNLHKCAPQIETLEVLDYALSPPPKRNEERIFAELMLELKALKNFKLFGYGTFPQIMLSSLSAQMHSLRSVEIVYVNFDAINAEEDDNESEGGSGGSSSVFTGLANCKQIEEIVVRNCHYAKEEHLAPLAQAEFPILRKIYIDECDSPWDKIMVAMIVNNVSSLETLHYCLRRPFWWQRPYRPPSDLAGILLGWLRKFPISSEKLHDTALALYNPDSRLKELSLF